MTVLVFLNKTLIEAMKTPIAISVIIPNQKYHNCHYILTVKVYWKQKSITTMTINLQILWSYTEDFFPSCCDLNLWKTYEISGKLMLRY